MTRALARPPFTDERGHKGWFERISRAQPHRVRELAVSLPGWPRFDKPLRIAFLSDFHVGSHAGDVGRFEAIVAETARFAPDLVLYGGDYVNMQPLGGGRVPPHVIARILGTLQAPLGRFAALGNHDFTYGAEEVSAALSREGIAVLDDTRTSVTCGGHAIELVGISDARTDHPQAHAALASLPAGPGIVLAHDPAWFAHVPAGPYLTLSGHTHGGQIAFPVIGPVVNASRAPLRWSYGHIVEGRRQLYVTSGLGTSGVPVRMNMPPEIVVLDVTGS